MTDNLTGRSLATLNGMIIRTGEEKAQAQLDNLAAFLTDRFPFVSETLKDMSPVAAAEKIIDQLLSERLHLLAESAEEEKDDA